jgi:hypothetical protein
MLVQFGPISSSPEEKGAGVVNVAASARFFLDGGLAVAFHHFFLAVRSPGDRHLSRPLTEAEMNAAKFPPSKTIAEHILTNAQDSRPVVQDFVPLAKSFEWELGFLDHFQQLCDKHKKDFYDRLSYVAADRSERMLTDVIRHGSKLPVAHLEMRWLPQRRAAACDPVGGPHD